MRRRRGRLAKKLTAVLIAAAMTFTCVPTAWAAQTAPASVVKQEDLVVSGTVRSVKAGVKNVYASVVAQDGLWVYCSALLKKSNRMFRMEVGTAIPVYQTVNNGEWIQVKTNYTKDGTKYTYGYIRNNPENVEINKATPEDWTIVENKQATVTTKSGLNVRSVAGTGYSSLGVLGYGESAPVIRTSDNWVGIKYKNSNGKYVQGFVSRNYVKITDVPGTTPAPTPTPSPTDTMTSLKNRSLTVTTSGSMLNVRQQPKSGSRILAVLPVGSVVTALSQNDKWREVRFYYKGDLVRGYVSRSYTRLGKSVDTPRLSVRNKTGYVGKGRWQQLYCTRSDRAALVQWSSSNSNVVSIARNGRMTYKKKGTVTITCKYRYGTGSWKTLKTVITVK